jgi:phosphonoacetate hydrolase
MSRTPPITTSVWARLKRTAFGRIIAAISARADADDVAIIVASDHGQISSFGLVDVAAKLTAAGHTARNAATRTLDGCVLAMTDGNMGEIRVLDGDLERRDAIARWLMQQDFIGMVLTPSDDPVRGDVDGTFSLKLVGMDHARAPHLMYVMRSGREADIYGLPGRGLITGGVPVGGGMHGGLNAHELNTVLMLGGAAARNGGSLSHASAGIIDIAPTILDLLGIARPQSMRGLSLMSADIDGSKLSRETFEVGTGTFRQQLTVARRGDHCFPVHGQRTG